MKKNKASVPEAEETEVSKAPHSFVIHRGNVGRSVIDLTSDFRQVMEPYTASNIKVRPKNVIKDFAHVSGLLNVSHLCSFTKTDLGPYLKLGRFPRGPTLTFRVNDYTLARDVRSSLKRQITYEKQYQNHALLIMNGFTGDGKEIQLMTSMFQNMFPSLNVTKVKINSVRRCVLLNYNETDGTIDFRHYTIKVVPVGMTKGVKKIVQGKIPNLSRYDDMAEFLAKSGALSDSEFEDDEGSKVELPQKVSFRGNAGSDQSSVRLVELGPRMTLSLMKIEEGLLDGEVLYHKLIVKTEEEKNAIRKAIEKKKREKENRKKEQEGNVKKKLDEKNRMREKSLAGMKKKNNNSLQSFQGSKYDNSGSSSEDDDAQWFEKEVGHKPDKELFETTSKDGARKRKRSASRLPKSLAAKKRMKNNNSTSPGLRRDRKEMKKNRTKKTFNNQGIGPNFRKDKKPNSKFNSKKKVSVKTRKR